MASSVLAGGVAYRFFLWLLPFGLIVGGALGFGDADSTEDALADGGIPSGVVNAIGDAARASDSARRWFLAFGVPLLLWAGYTGAKAMQLIHTLVWNEEPPRTAPLKSSLAFTGVCLGFMGAVALAWWVRDSSWFVALVAAVVAFVPLLLLWLWTSLQLPHGNASLDFAARLVVTAPVLNSSLHEELRKQSRPGGDGEQANLRTISAG